MCEKGKTLCLFDVDGTLTKPRKIIEKSMLDFLVNEVKPKCTLALVGGSDYEKISEQLTGEDGLKHFDYVFSENGLVARRHGEIINSESILQFLGEEKLQSLINFCLLYMSGLVLPAKRGTFVEFRSGLINICPVGRSCSQKEREEFAKFDEDNNVRGKFVAELKKKFPANEFHLTFAIGGQISIDVFPEGWDKRYCLKFLEEFSSIYFFGDKTEPGGNDHELFCDDRVKGTNVTGPDHTKECLKKLLSNL